MLGRIIITALLTIQSQVLYTLGNNCETLDGFWISEFGTELILQHTADGRLYGNLKTYDHSELVDKYGNISGISGAAPYQKPGTTFGFSVTYGNGMASRAWTGQCMMCEDKETILTSWLMRLQVSDCVHKWKSTLIGQEKFTRTNSNTQWLQPNPPDSLATGLVVIPTVPPGPACASIYGPWYNELGSEMLVTREETAFFEGEYRTAVERKKGSAGTTHSNAYGQRIEGEANATTAFFVVWRQGASVTSFVGQCHVCENGTEILETTWILRAQIENCVDDWKSTTYGQNSFTRTEQRDGPRKQNNTHTPGDLGEGTSDGDTTKPPLTCGGISLYTTVSAIYLEFAILFYMLLQH